MSSLTPFTQKVCSHCAAHISLFMHVPILPRPRAWLLQVIWLPGYNAWGFTVAYAVLQEDDGGGDDDMMTGIEVRLGLSLTMYHFKSHIHIHTHTHIYTFSLFNTPINPRRQALLPLPPSTWRSWDTERLNNLPDIAAAGKWRNYKPSWLSPESSASNSSASFTFIVVNPHSNP